MEKVKSAPIEKKYLIRMIFGSIAAAVLYAIAVRCFIQAPGSNILAGGISGISLIISRLITPLTDEQSTFYSIFYFVLNFPLIIIAYRYIGKWYSIFTLITIALTSLLVAIIPQDFFAFMNLNAEDDMILIALAAGVFAGCSTGVALMTGASGGGVDVIITIIGLKQGKKVGYYGFVINAAILIIGGIIFGQWRDLLYTIVFMFVNSTFINVIYIRNNKVMLEIVTNMEEEIAEKLMTLSHHGVTVFECEGAYTHSKRYEIRSIVYENEVKDLLREVKKIDEHAFVTIVPVRSVHGNFHIQNYK